LWAVDKSRHPNAGYVKSVPPPEQVEWLADKMWTEFRLSRSNYNSWEKLPESVKEDYRNKAHSILRSLGKQNGGKE